MAAMRHSVNRLERSPSLDRVTCSLLSAVRWLFTLVLASQLAGCTVEGLQIQDAELAADSKTTLLMTSPDGPKSAFTTQDEKATLVGTFGYNFVATYLVYTVKWYAPAGHAYLTETIRTQWGTHRYIVATMPIRGETPSRMPGEWEVVLSHKGRELLRKKFTIVEAPPSPDSSDPSSSHASHPTHSE